MVDALDAAGVDPDDIVENSVESHACADDDPANGIPPARVTVNGVRIPVINDGIRTELRTDAAVGEGYVTRHSEVYFPSKWPIDDGDPYRRVVNALNPSAGPSDDTPTQAYVPVDVDIYDNSIGEYTTIHRGFVMGVGSGARGDIEMRMTIGDAGQLLGALPFGREYNAGKPLRSIVLGVKNRLEQAVEPAVFERVDLKNILYEDDLGDGVLTDPIGERNEDSDGFLETIGGPVPGSDIVGDLYPGDVIERGIEFQTRQRFQRGTAIAVTGAVSSGGKNFQRNRHTAADALRYVQKRVPGYFEMRPSNGIDTTAISLTYNNLGNRTIMDAEHLDGDIPVLRNNALHEARPINGLVAAGEASNGSFPYVHVVHPELVRSASEVLQPKVFEADATDMDELVQMAANELRDRLSSETLGNIRTLPVPALEPHTTLRSQPACGNTVRDTTPVRYQVQSVVHNISATEQDDRHRHQTEVRATLDTTPITVVETGRQDVDDQEANWSVMERETVIERLFELKVLEGLDNRGDDRADE